MTSSCSVPQGVSVPGWVCVEERSSAGIREREDEAGVAAGQLSVCLHSARPGGRQRPPATQAEEDRGPRAHHHHRPDAHGDGGGHVQEARTPPDSRHSQRPPAGDHH